MKLPQLSLRELFLLVALVAVGCGWWVRERQLRRANEEDYGRRVEWAIETGEKWRAERTELRAQIESLQTGAEGKRLSSPYSEFDDVQYFPEGQVIDLDKAKSYPNVLQP